MKSMHKVHRGWILFLFCFFIYPPMLKASSLISYILIYGIPAAYLLLNYKLLSKITMKQLCLMGLAMLLVILSVLYPIAHGTGDFSYIMTATYIFRKLLVFIFLSCIIVKEYKGDCTSETFMYYYACTHAVYVIGTLILVVFPQFKSLWFNVFSEVIDSEQYLQTYGYTFRIGWRGFSGFRLTLQCSISCIFLLHLYFVGGAKGKIKISKFIVPYILCFAGNMFYGRSGLVITIISSFAAFLIWNKADLRRFLILIGIAIVGFIVLFQLKDIAFFSDWYYWVTTPIKNLITTGSFNNYSFSGTMNMIFMPKLSTILFGDGYYTMDGHYYMGTDSGVMRNILFWGVLGAIISYGITISAIFETKHKNLLLCLLLLFCFAAFEFKGDVYYEFSSLFIGLSFFESIRNRFQGKQLADTGEIGRRGNYGKCNNEYI